MAKNETKNQTVKTAQNTEFKTTDKTFEIGYYNSKGYLNKGSIFRVVGGIFGATFLATNIVETEILYKFVENISIETFSDLNFQLELLSNLPTYHYDKIMSNFPNGQFKFNKDCWDSLLSLTASLMASSYVSNLKFKDIRFKAGIQESLSSMGLNQYYMEKKIKEKDGNYTFIFKLQKGETMDYDGFLNKAENLQQLFEVGKFKTGRVEKNKVILSFYDVVPELQFFYKKKQYNIDEKIQMVADGIGEKEFITKSTCLRTDFTEFLGENKSLLGIQDIKGKPLYASFPSTVGVIQGHTLIAGGTGSGKSFATSNLVKTFLTPDNYQNMDTIFDINMKEGSIDWRFLQGINKVVSGDITDGIDAVLNVLKKAQLKMIANNRDNNLQGNENTNFGQCIVIIDEIHKFKMMSGDKTLNKVDRQKADKCIYIIDELATQARSANMFIIAILQKATLDNLSGVFRSQISNGILLRADEMTSTIIIDEEIQKKEGIDSKKLSPGKFIYIDYNNNLIREGFAVQSIKKWDIDEINKYKETEELINGKKRTEDLIELAKIVARLKYENGKAQEENKDFLEEIGSYESLETEKRDYWGEAQIIYDKQNITIDSEVSTDEEEIKDNQNKLQSILDYSSSDNKDNIDNFNDLVKENDNEEDEEEVVIGGEVKINIDLEEEVIESKIEDKEELEEKSPVDKNSFFVRLKANKIKSENDLEEDKEEEQNENDLEEYEREQDDKEEEKFDKIEEIIKSKMIDKDLKEEIIIDEKEKEEIKELSPMDLLKSL